MDIFFTGNVFAFLERDPNQIPTE